MELNDFPKVFQLISARAEIQPRSTWRKAQAFSTILHLQFTLSKQLSHWKLEPPVGSTWQGTITDLTAKILIQPSTVPFAFISPYNSVRDSIIIFILQRGKLEHRACTTSLWHVSGRVGLNTWHLATLSSDLHSLGPQPLNERAISASLVRPQYLWISKLLLWGDFMITNETMAMKWTRKQKFHGIKDLHKSKWFLFSKGYIK